MEAILSKRLGLIAGDGELPIKLARSAKNMGFSTIAISLAPCNRKQLTRYCEKVYSFGPGEIQKIVDTLHKENIKQVSFIGKVHKGLLLRNPRLDSRAFKLIKQRKRLNDDQVMFIVIEELESENINVLDQTLFIKDLLAEKGVLSNLNPTSDECIDIEYGFQIAKQMGKIDIGQSVVVQNKMILAVEAIEGTDRAIQRGCRLGNGNAVVVKVSKPNQDNRFDIPTVGLNTLKNMKKFGGKVLAIEANETFIIEKNEMIEFADKHKMVVVAV
ncbi:MAG: UDP-2,3-diacylglucosamine diphosphatase LpxI [Candidatus Gastranaerophilales bacterium]|nr:UDP-2,3-diacylglucosamine diphosphatase LpxI [Candidatus Gastranaerophilales bacterium]